jgi:hypothetical protein
MIRQYLLKQCGIDRFDGLTNPAKNSFCDGRKIAGVEPAADDSF